MSRKLNKSRDRLKMAEATVQRLRREIAVLRNIKRAEQKPLNAFTVFVEENAERIGLKRADVYAVTVQIMPDAYAFAGRLYSPIQDYSYLAGSIADDVKHRVFDCIIQAMQGKLVKERFK